MPTIFLEKWKFSQLFLLIHSRVTKELNEFTYSLNGFINITEILTESTRFFPSLFQYTFILPLPLLSTEKLFFLCLLLRTHTHIHSSLRSLSFSLPIGIIRAFSTFNVFVGCIPQSDMLTCFQFFLLSCLSISLHRAFLTYTREEKWKIGSKSERCEVKETQTDRLTGNG